MLSISDINNVVFDFDGVIVDSERKKFSDLQEILKSQNYFLNESYFRNFIGKKRGQFLKEIGILNVDEVMIKVHKKDLEINNINLIDGLENLLEYLNKNDVNMHIATGSSKRFVMALLEKFGILKYFNKIITGDDIKESKPNPKVYLEIKHRLNNDKIIVIEDSPAGVVSAKKAGLFVIGLGKGLHANIEFPTFEELLNHLS